MKTKIIFTDGGCSGSNQKDLSKRRMVICYYDQSMKTPFIRRAFQGEPTNNVAEIIAIREAMRHAINMGYKDLLIKTDSMVSIYWIKNKKLKNKNITDYDFVKKVLNHILEMIDKGFDTFDIIHVPREKNTAGIILEEKTKNFGVDYL